MYNQLILPGKTRQPRNGGSKAASLFLNQERIDQGAQYIFLSLSILSSIGGWVEKMFIRLFLLNGLEK